MCFHLQELRLDKIFEWIREKLENALHIEDLINELKSAFSLGNLSGADHNLSSSSANVSKVHEVKKYKASCKRLHT